MKKSLFVLGMAVAAFASCTNEEVMEVASNRAIRFDNAFVGNVTKADIANDASFTKFYVFGDAKLTSGGEYHDVFTNDDVTGAWSGEPATATWTAKETYWETNSTYKFAAYSDGNSKLEEVKYDPTDSSEKLTITNYTAGANDLVAALKNDITTDGDVTNESAVGLTFNHLLSKVQFTMQTTAGTEITVKVNSIKFNAIKTTDCEYTSAGATWTTASKNTAEYSYDVKAMTDITEGEQKAVQYVIPQSCASIEATIGLTISGPGIPADKQENTVKASMAFSKGSGAGTDNTWEPGYSYNYIAVIEPSKIIDGLNVIKFTVEKVEGWTTTGDQTPAISK